MTSTPAYWIDAGVLIYAHRGPYPHHRVPKFWAFLHTKLESGIIGMPRTAHQEIVDGGYDDILCSWCKDRKALGLCHRETKAVQAAYGQVIAHVQTKHTQHQLNEFMRGADGWVIAYAMATNGAAVSEENAKRSKARVKIPTVCRAMDVKCLTLFQLLDALGAEL